MNVENEVANNTVNTEQNSDRRPLCYWVLHNRCIHIFHINTHTHTHTHYCLKKIAKEHEVARQSTAIYAQKIYIYTAIHVVYLAHERSTDSCTWGHS